MPNEFSHCYILDMSISVLREFGGSFHVYEDFDTIFFKQTVDTLIRRRVLRRLVCVRTVYLYPTITTQGLYGLTISKTEVGVLFATRKKI